MFNELKKKPDAAIHQPAINAVTTALMQLAQGASLEANVHDTPHLEACVSMITPGARMFVSHLPNQRWEDTCATSAAVKSLGLKPVPHVPVRLIENDYALHTLLHALANQAQIDELLLISGDYREARGPFSAVVDVLSQFPFADYGIKTVSMAGHPEGHPSVALETIRDAEQEKCRVAAERNLRCRLVTQFFFEAEPFVTWAQNQVTMQLPTERVAGIAGPASVGSLFKFALRCGVGPSLRALGVRPGSVMKLLGDYTPNDLLLALSLAQLQQPALFSGIHMFCFGGLVRSCTWLNAVARGNFSVSPGKGLRVQL